MKTTLKGALLILSFVAGGQSCEESRHLESYCGGYCYLAMHPLLQYTKQLKEQVDSQQEPWKSSLETRVEAMENLLKIQQANTNLRGINTAFEKIGSNYYYIGKHDRLNWFAAAHKCRELGAHLVNFQSQEELDAVSEKLKPNNFWVDISDLANGGQFLSLTTGRKPTFLNWVNGEPNHFDNKEHCVEVKPAGSAYAMNDYICNTDFHYVCKLTNSDVEIL